MPPLASTLAVPGSCRCGKVSRPILPQGRVKVSERNVRPETFGQADGGVWRPAPSATGRRRGLETRAERAWLNSGDYSCPIPKGMQK